jgi:hypothetical protein
MEPKRLRDDQEEEQDTAREQHVRRRVPCLPKLVHPFFIFYPGNRVMKTKYWFQLCMCMDSIVGI